MRQILVMTVVLATASCAGLDRRDQGTLQPQTVDGPCQVTKFFLLGLTTVHTSLTAASTGQACRMTLINPALNAPVTAALVTVPAQHGLATAGLITGGYQAAITYTPQPGYAGPDRFSVTLEPADHAIAFAVTVVPPAN